MPETKRMHYVPQTYLKHFAKEVIKGNEKEYFIDCVPKNNIEIGSIKSINIKHICLENDIYTLTGETEEKRMLIENLYKTLYEDDYDHIYSLLKDRNKDKVTPIERYKIISFVVSMFLRNTSWGNSHNKLMDDVYAKVFALAKNNSNTSFFMENEEISIANKTLEELQKESRLQDRPMIALIQAEKIFQLIRIRLQNDVITIINIKDNSFKFITSDNPVFCESDSTQINIPFDPNNTLSIAIDNKNLLQLRPWANELEKNMLGRIEAEHLIAMTSTLAYNNFQSKQANRFILGCEIGLKNFISQKDKYN